MPRDLIERIVDCARWTGSARNAQPWRFVHVTDGPTRHRLSRLGTYAGPVAVAPSLLVLLHDEASTRRDTAFDLGRITQTVCLVAARDGLATCPVTFHPEANGRAAAAEVGAGAGWRADHAIALGRPRPSAARGTSAVPVGRLALDQVLTHHEAD